MARHPDGRGAIRQESGAFPGQQPHCLTTGSSRVAGRQPADPRATGSGHTLVNDQVAVIADQGSCGDEVGGPRLAVEPVLRPRPVGTTEGATSPSPASPNVPPSTTPTLSVASGLRAARSAFPKPSRRTMAAPSKVAAGLPFTSPKLTHLGLHTRDTAAAHWVIARLDHPFRLVVRGST